MLENKNNQLTFGGHLEVLRRMLFRILGVTLIISIGVFILKDYIWELLLAPSKSDFITYKYIEKLLHCMGVDFHFETYNINLIATELSSQFVTHVTTSLYLGLLLSSPYILIELFQFILPALYDNERKYSAIVAFIVYLLFIIGILVCYLLIFPISFRFLGTYSVSETVCSMITLKSYVSTFTSLTLVMGIVFQLPIIIFILTKMGVVNYDILIKYRKYALFIITATSAIITPPDILSCLLVTLPLYSLYECSIWIAKKVNRSCA